LAAITVCWAGDVSVRGLRRGVWVNGIQPEDAPDRMRVGDSDEIAVLPPISGG
jgi:molybdopterin converting factor small subunit